MRVVVGGESGAGPRKSLRRTKLMPRTGSDSATAYPGWTAASGAEEEAGRPWSGRKERAERSDLRQGIQTTAKEEESFRKWMKKNLLYENYRKGFERRWFNGHFHRRASVASAVGAVRRSGWRRSCSSRRRSQDERRMYGRSRCPKRWPTTVLKKNIKNKTSKWRQTRREIIHLSSEMTLVSLMKIIHNRFHPEQKLFILLNNIAPRAITYSGPNKFVQSRWHLK